MNGRDITPSLREGEESFNRSPNLVTVRQGDDFARVSFDVVGLSELQLAAARIAFKSLNVDGGDPNEVGDAMCDIVTPWAADRLTDVLHHIAHPRGGPLVLSRHGALGT